MPKAPPSLPLQIPVVRTPGCDEKQVQEKKKNAKKKGVQ
jgi:hypothetical protein